MLRHTTPLVEAGTCYGQTDLDVADSFEHEVSEVLRRLPSIATIVSSPLRRCHKLAARIASHHNLSIRTDARLMEMDFGDWEGQLWSAIPRTDLDQWTGDFYRARPHGGESVEILKNRVDAALSEIQTMPTPALIITHAGVIRAALARGEDAQDYQTEIGFGEFVRLPETAQESR